MSLTPTVGIEAARALNEAKMKKKLPLLKKETVRTLVLAERLQDVAGGASGSNGCSTPEASCYLCQLK